MTFNGSGLLSGVPADGTVGSYTVCAVATSAGAAAATQNITFSVTTAPLTITASSADDGPRRDGADHHAELLGVRQQRHRLKSLTMPRRAQQRRRARRAVGNYPSTCSGAVDPNYTISYTAGSVTVNPSFYVTTTEVGLLRLPLMAPPTDRCSWRRPVARRLTNGS